MPSQVRKTNHWTVKPPQTSPLLLPESRCLLPELARWLCCKSEALSLQGPQYMGMHTVPRAIHSTLLLMMLCRCCCPRAYRGSDARHTSIQGRSFPEPVQLICAVSQNSSVSMCLYQSEVVAGAAAESTCKWCVIHPDMQSKPPLLLQTASQAQIFYAVMTALARLKEVLQSYLQLYIASISIAYTPYLRRVSALQLIS